MGKTKKITNSVIAVLALLILVSTAVVLYFVIREANYPRHTVSFETGEILNKNEFQDKRYKEGSVLQEWDGVPLVADKMFLDWYADAELEEKVVFPLTITEDITVYAKYLDGNLPESFYQYDAESDSYFVVKGTEDLPETTIVPDVHNGANGVKRVTKIEGGTNSGSSIDKTTLPLGNSTTVKNLYLGNCVSSIGRYAAAYNTALEYAYIGRNAETYGASIFSGCSVLTDATLPRKMTEIPLMMFYQAGFTSLDFLGENITTLGERVFASCPFVELVIPEHITRIGAGSFYKCNSMTSVVGNGVISMDEQAAFWGCANLISVEFNKIEYINGNSTFNTCTNLTDVSLPNLKTTGEHTFEKCSGLQEISLPKVEVLRKSTFNQCTQLNSVSIPNAVEIGDFAFNQCTSLQEIDLPKVKSIGIQGFYKCAFQSINLPNVESIGQSAFTSCSNLSSINYPKIKYIGSSALSSTKLNPILPEGLIWIGNHAFSHNAENATVESITIPSTLVQLGGTEFIGDNEENNILSSHVFYNCGCGTVKEFIVAEGNKHFDAVDGVLFTKNHKYLLAYPSAKPEETFEIPEGCVDFGEMAFNRTHFLKTLVLPNSFTIHTDLPEDFNLKKLYKDDYPQLYGYVTNLFAGVYEYTSIENFKLKEDNNKYKEIDGILYSLDGKELLGLASGRISGKEIKFADSLERIDKVVFFLTDDVFTYSGIGVGGCPTKVTIGANLKEICDGQLFEFAQRGNGSKWTWEWDVQSPYFQLDDTGDLIRKEA